MGLNKRERGEEGGGMRGAAQYVRRNYISFEGINLTVLQGIQQYIMHIL